MLDGVFQDENGNFPTGTYVRNPPTTRHSPRSEKGCTIFVKLWQFDSQDRHQYRKAMAVGLAQPVNGIATSHLHCDGRETVTYRQIDACVTLEMADAGGLEMLVSAGIILEHGETLGAGTWLRLPQGHMLTAVAGPNGAKVWIKSGHLAYVKPPAI